MYQEMKILRPRNLAALCPHLPSSTLFVAKRPRAARLRDPAAAGKARQIVCRCRHAARQAAKAKG
jgi:hypothetical protein